MFSTNYSPAVPQTFRRPFDSKGKVSQAISHTISLAYWHLSLFLNFLGVFFQDLAFNSYVSQLILFLMKLYFANDLQALKFYLLSFFLTLSSYLFHSNIFPFCLSFPLFHFLTDLSFQIIFPSRFLNHTQFTPISHFILLSFLTSSPATHTSLEPLLSQICVPQFPPTNSYLYAIFLKVFA